MLNLAAEGVMQLVLRRMSCRAVADSLRMWHDAAVLIMEDQLLRRVAARMLSMCAFSALMAWRVATTTQGAHTTVTNSNSMERS